MFFFFLLEGMWSTPPLPYYFFVLTISLIGVIQCAVKLRTGDTVTVTHKGSEDVCSAVSPVEVNFTTKQQHVTC